MKKLSVILALTCAFLQDVKSQGCVGGFIFQYTGVTHTVWFKDQSNANQAGWQHDYTNWNFNDGSAVSTGTSLTHTFPTAAVYNVVKETKFSQISNPSNFCIKKDSVYIDASQAVPGCTPKYKMKVQWLTDSTYGVSTYFSGCNYTLRETGTDYGFSCFFPANSPMNTMFSTSQPFFTYTLPTRDSNYVFAYHIIMNSSNAATACFSLPKTNIPSTPANCHASFFMIPSDSTLKNWTVQDYSSGAGPLSYSWNFGDGTTSTLPAPAHTYSTVGVYTICLTVTSGTCSDTFCSTAFTDTSVITNGMKQINTMSMGVGISKNSIKEVEWQVYPNPTRDKVKIEFGKSLAEDSYLQIFDLFGKKQLTQKLTAAEAGGTVDLSILSSGVFLAELKTKDGLILGHKKIIKE